jgi:hypothetical protein
MLSMCYYHHQRVRKLKERMYHCCYTAALLKETILSKLLAPLLLPLLLLPLLPLSATAKICVCYATAAKSQC